MDLIYRAIWGLRARSRQKSVDVPLESGAPGAYSSLRRFRSARNVIDRNKSFCPVNLIFRVANEHDLRLWMSSQRWAAISPYSSSGSAGIVGCIGRSDSSRQWLLLWKFTPGPDSHNAASGSWPLNHICCVHVMILLRYGSPSLTLGPGKYQSLVGINHDGEDRHH